MKKPYTHLHQLIPNTAKRYDGSEEVRQQCLIGELLYEISTNGPPDLREWMFYQKRAAKLLKKNFKWTEEE